MEQKEEILQYLKRNGKCRAYQVVANVGAPRRQVFKLLKILRRRGQVKHEGLHPKIYYSYISGLEEETETTKEIAPTPEAATQKAPPKSKDSTDQRKIAGSSHAVEEFWALKNDLNRCQTTLKSTQADLRYKESQFQEMKARWQSYMKENNELRERLMKAGIKL